jgi:hypothetical protein
MSMNTIAEIQPSDARDRSTAVARSAVVAIALFAILLAGCGKQYGTVPVRGKVTYNGGPMPARGVVYFTPLEAFGGHPMRPATGDFEADGSYTAFSFANAEGLFPGVYEAHLHCWKVPPTMDGPRAISHLPAKYGKPDASGLTLTVEEGSSGKEFNIDISTR